MFFVVWRRVALVFLGTGNKSCGSFATGSIHSFVFLIIFLRTLLDFLFSFFMSRG